MPAVTTAGAPGGLREFYENPDTPASSGPDRAVRMARMLGQALDGVPGPACILDVGCGDGAAAVLAAQRNPGHRVIGLDWSAGSLGRARRLGPDRGARLAWTRPASRSPPSPPTS